MARPEENQRLETRHVGASKRAFRARLPPIFTLCSFKITVFLRVSYEPQNLLPQNRRFVRGFCQFSAHLTKCNARNAICTLSPLDAALTMRLAKNTQRDTSKVLLPRKTTMEVAKVLRLPRKLERIFWKRRKSIALATQNDFWHVMKTCWIVTKCHACHAKRGYVALCGIGNLQKWLLLQDSQYRHGHTRFTPPPVNGCEWLRP